MKKACYLLALFVVGLSTTMLRAEDINLKINNGYLTFIGVHNILMRKGLLDKETPEFITIYEGIKNGNYVYDRELVNKAVNEVFPYAGFIK